MLRLLCLLLALAPAALAQAPQTPEAASPVPSPVPSLAAEADPTPPPAGREILPRAGLFRVLGQDVKNAAGIVVAQVVNLLVDEAGQPRAAVLDYGGFLGVGRRRIAVAWPALTFSGEGIRLGLTRDQLKNFPEYREGEDIILALPPSARPVAGAAD
ncbi:PRC-barrel domain-containing protein [Roseomonas sp. GC11]|uniref:PRC-barrel domain-containing protein n=1 Tax=Roseomonas sp. GC11 TaxID=2950546 RepID=UPI00210ACBB8|nr:PRC-barrel domain-containing protein [Roseomonas sp. GC11]MCQ4159552.1 PRC-barrel domain-containing protein [Roseomonas sp. GC11]